MKEDSFFKTQIRRVRAIWQYQKCKSFLKPLSEALSSNGEKIPVLIVSYNNGVYVENTVNQLASFHIKPIVLDNHSNSPQSLAILNSIMQSGKAYVVFGKKNLGHLVGFQEPIYRLLPEVFAYSDPDLGFNRNLPSDFVGQLAHLAKKYKVFKAGFALEFPKDQALNPIAKRNHFFKPFGFERVYDIEQWESVFWARPLRDPNFEVYAADVDTTFAVYVKSNYRGNLMDAIRVGGDFAAVHLPWFPDLDLMNRHQKSQYLHKNKSTTWVKN